MIEESTPLVERWDGNAWSVERVRLAGGLSFNPFKALTAVSCASDTSCIAVGYSGSSESGGGCCSGFDTLSARWDGNRWSLLDTPDPTRHGLTGAALTDVWCSYGGVCVAVADQMENILSIGARWNGRRWGLQNTWNSRRQDAITILDGLSCITSSACFAVGSVESSTSAALAERYR